MANLDFDKTPVVEPNDIKIFGTADVAVQFEKLFTDDAPLQRTLSSLQRGPVRFYRDNVVVFEDDLDDYLLFVVSGAVRSCKTCKNGSRNVVALYLPGDLFGKCVLKAMMSCGWRAVPLASSSGQSHIHRLLRGMGGPWEFFWNSGGPRPAASSSPPEGKNIEGQGKVEMPKSKKPSLTIVGSSPPNQLRAGWAEGCWRCQTQSGPRYRTPFT